MARERAAFVDAVVSNISVTPSFKKNRNRTNREVAMAPKDRKLEWVKRPNFQGWACTECAWVFNLSWPFAGKSIDDMKTEFEQHRDKEFASHVCAEHLSATKNPG